MSRYCDTCPWEQAYAEADLGGADPAYAPPHKKGILTRLVEKKFNSNVTGFEYCILEIEN